MAPESRSGPCVASVFEVSMPRACTRRPATAATARVSSHQPSVSAEQTISRPMRVGTYSVALPCARWAMSIRSAGSDGIWLPVAPRTARYRVTFAPRTNTRMPMRAMQMITTLLMTALASHRAVLSNVGCAGLVAHFVRSCQCHAFREGGDVVEEAAHDRAADVAAQEGIGLVHAAGAGDVDLDE